jgi:hypothetical protein
MNDNPTTPPGGSPTGRDRDEDLRKVPAWDRGELPPSEAHRIALLLREDAGFRAEAERERFLAAGFARMRPDPLPRHLVARSVKAAVGEEATGSWISLDNLLIALGVGVGCAATAQFFGQQVDVLSMVGSWLGELAGVAVDSSLRELIGGLVLGSFGVLVGGGLGAWRLLKSR